MKNLKLEAIIIALGIIIGAYFLNQGIKQFVYKERIVTVKGLAEKEVKADKVTWPIHFEVVGNSQKEIYNKIKINRKKILDYLTKNGISDNEITINPVQTRDLKANGYNKEAIFRYNAHQNITVSSKRVDKIRKLTLQQEEFLEMRIQIIEEYGNYIDYEYTELNTIKPDMIAEATKNAHIAAEKFCKDNDSEIGKLKTARQGQFYIYDRDQTTPYIKRVRVVNTITYYLK